MASFSYLLVIIMFLLNGFISGLLRETFSRPFVLRGVDEANEIF